MFNIEVKTTLGLVVSFVLLGCGGSGGGETNAAVPAVASASNVQAASADTSVEVEVEKTAMQMSSLVADPGFNFTSKKQIQVALNLSEHQDQRAYVSVYRKYKRLESGSYYPDAASRVLGGVLQDGLFNSSFVGLNKQSAYLIEVWFYDGTEPLQKEWLVNGAALTW
ncbi:hypothetical protein [Psychromonas ossibalaenae]|uniref:hypothetical protein n=1 Tax=Psychromonas ossibalaenae TaxID=444922 RepID=UPI00035DF7B4|nr:hypothetical protein [Psychromonas ossibalaenae]